MSLAATGAGVTTARPIWVSHGNGGLGSRVLRRLSANEELRAVTVDECEVLVWLAAADADLLSLPDDGPLAGLATALQGSTALQHVVLVSSAMVYGSWADNPIPLSEDALIRPNVKFAYARQLGGAEQLVDAWRRDQPGRTATILRPAIAMAADGSSRLATALAAGMGRRAGTADPPSQFLHLDDLANAVVLASEQMLDGVFNVAPDGWIAGERVRALAGAVPRLKLPDRVNEVVADLRWRFQRGPIPPGLHSYTHSPWLVANDRLKAVGWEPLVTNEQAYVEGTEAKWWTMVSPKRRQELALAAVATAVVAAIVWSVRAVRRARQRRR